MTMSLLISCHHHKLLIISLAVNSLWNVSFAGIKWS